MQGWGYRQGHDTSRAELQYRVRGEQGWIGAMGTKEGGYGVGPEGTVVTAKREISLRISDEYLVYIDQVSTASELWTGLQRISQSKVAIGMIHLCQIFFQMFVKDGANMEEHIQKLQGIYLQLNARGHVITDDDLANTILTLLLKT